MPAFPGPSTGDPNDLYANDNSGRWQKWFEQYSPDSQYYTGQDGSQYANPNYRPPADPGTGDNPSANDPHNIYDGIDINSLPDWLKPHSMHDFTKELKNEYRGTKKAYNVNDEVQKYLDSANSGFAMSLQQGNNIASETAARAYQSGIPGQTNTGAIAAQFALPALQARSEAQAKAATITTSAAQAAAQARASLASALSQARNQYANTLATYRGQNISHEEFQSKQNLDFIKFQQELQASQNSVSGVGPAGADRNNLAAIVSALTKAQLAAPETLTDTHGEGLDPLNDNYANYRKKLMDRLLAITGATQGSGSGTGE